MHPLLQDLAPSVLEDLLRFRCAEPHAVLGPHSTPEGLVVRAFRPDAAALVVVREGPVRSARPMERVHEAGLWALLLPHAEDASAYHFELETHHGERLRVEDPYRFAPTLEAFEVHLWGEGTLARPERTLGAHLHSAEGVAGVRFAVWAPRAARVSVVGAWNHHDGRYHPMRRLGAGVWELFLPGLGAGEGYHFEVQPEQGPPVRKQDPFARRTALRPATEARVEPPSSFAWTDAEWLRARAGREPRSAPMSIYEVHLGSWRREGGRNLSYRELATQLGDYALEMGFTHLQVLPLLEHPFDGSWGYQVTGYWAPSARFGSPEDLRAFVDALHERGLGVLLDWVPAHFPKDAWALARFDGEALFEHPDPRRGAHPDWGTLVFDYGRAEVRNFLVRNALYWLREFHFDGLRVDAVASMLYLDYSRSAGRWLPNRYGGREHLEAIAFLRELNERALEEAPGAMIIAEESTSWPGVTRATAAGGLGFTFKWNMGWMHDTLEYFSLDPLFRRFHHGKLTFGMLYQYDEQFVLPLSHDEVVHLKASLLGKMPGDAWQRFATLRALLGYQWCHPGKKLLFMGGELAQPGEWNHDAELPWHLLAQELHRGVQRWVRDLNRVYRAHASLWQQDGASAGFQWVVVGDSDQSVLAFLRFDRERARPLLCVLNATPVPRRAYRMGVPSAGRWEELLNSDAGEYGGSGQGNYGGVASAPTASHGFEHSVELTLPPLGILVLAGPPAPLPLPPSDVAPRARALSGPGASAPEEPVEELSPAEKAEP